MIRLGCCLLALVMAAGCAERTAVVAPPAPKPPPPKKESPPRVLSPQVDRTEEDQLRQDATTKIQKVEQMVRQVNPERFSREHAETFSTVRSFLAGAKQAVAARDFLRASNLAEKARVLADELIRSQQSRPPAGVRAN
jgi:hypothetical protein